MSKQSIWTIVSIVIVVVGVAMYFYLEQRNNEIEREEQSLQALESALEESRQNSNLDLPSSNPLGEDSSGVNPMEETNPFNNGYENPFE